MGHRTCHFPIRVVLVSDFRELGQQNNWTLLHQASSTHQVKCVQVLVDAIPREALDLQTYHGSTAVSLAAMRGDLDVVKILAAAGATLDLKNNRGRIPEVEAGLRHHDECRDFLREARLKAEELALLELQEMTSR